MGKLIVYIKVCDEWNLVIVVVVYYIFFFDDFFFVKFCNVGVVDGEIDLNWVFGFGFILVKSDVFDYDVFFII